MTRIKFVTQADSTVWLVIAVDSAAELVTHIRSMKFAPGSLALVVNESKVYALNSSEQWVEQPNIILAI